MTFVAVFCALNLSAQIHIEPQYNIEDGGFCCTNGKNKYTRALYGSTTDYRIETSDRPLFAVYTKKEKRNIRFYINVDGKSIALDSLPCTSTYADGKRCYQLDNLYISVMSIIGEAGCYFVFSPNNIARKCHLKVCISTVKRPRMRRNGDLGVEERDAFDADSTVLTFDLGYLSDKPKYIKLTGIDKFSLSDKTSFEQAENQYQQVKTIKAHTPDKFINAAIEALPYAANGLWDGKTFLHGAVGWRTELPGWRGGYVGDVLGWSERAKSHFRYYADEQIKDVNPIYPHPSQDSTKNLARARKQWGTQMYSNGYITSKGKMNHYDMNLVYIDELLWHFQYDADTTFMRLMWPTIKSSIEWEKRNYDPDGDHLYDAYACIWASDALYYNGGAVTHSSAYNYRANLLAARIAEIIGEDPSPFKHEADAIHKAMNESLWVDTLGHWAEYKDLMGLKRLHTDAAIWTYYTPIDEGLHNNYDLSSLDKLKVPTSWGGYVYRTSDWEPYAWSINNVVAAENYHMALAFFELGEKQRGYELLRNTILDNMVYGHSPGNYGQLLTEDEHRGECYRDFGDCIGIASRAIVQGLFGIIPDALNGKCYIRPGFPETWDSVSISLPYISYKYTKAKGIYDVVQNFPQKLDVIIEAIKAIQSEPGIQKKGLFTPIYTILHGWQDNYRRINIEKYYNDSTCNLYKKKYFSPRPNVTTLEIPVQGAGDWCSTDYVPTVSDSSRVAFTSLWDNYPDSIEIKVNQRADSILIELFGSTNWMQSHIDNGVVTAKYTDGTRTDIPLVNPDNWLPNDKPVFLAFRADSNKKIESIILKTLSNDVVIGVKRLGIMRCK